MRLTEYLIGQVIETSEGRLAALRDYFPDAKQADWCLEKAGQRVQIIKPDPVKGGVLEFGTQLVGDANKTILAMLGASPGASTAVSIMVNVLERCFSDLLSTPEGKKKMAEMIPSYGQSLIDDAKLCKQIRDETASVLKIGQI